MRKWLLMLGILALSASVFSAWQQASISVNDARTGMPAHLAEHAAALGIEVDSARPGFASDWWLLSTAQGDYHLHDSGTLLVAGEWFDTRNPEQVINLSERELRVQRRQRISQSAATAVRFQAPNERAHIDVFTDPTCGYCRRFHRHIDELHEMGISVRYHAFPRAGDGSQGAAQLATVWCHSQPQAALDAAKSETGLTVIDAKRSQCERTVQEQMQLGRRLGVQGTPTIILPDGRLLVGYRNPSQLAEALGL